MKKEQKFKASIPRYRYWKSDLKGNRRCCPRCGSSLEKEYHSYMVVTEMDGERDSFITGNDNGLFCRNCPVVVLDQKVFGEPVFAATGKKELQIAVNGIVDFEAIPENKKHIPLGEDDNPIPLVEFLDDEPNEKELLEKIICLEEEKEYDQALMYVEEILEQNPLSYHALFLKARISKKIGKSNLSDFRLAYSEAKKQDASKEVLELMQEELDDVDIENVMELAEKAKEYNKDYTEENHIIAKPIKDYGRPALTKKFFDKNQIEMFSAACIGYNLLLNPEIEKKTMNKLYKKLSEPRKSEVDKERKEILDAKTHEHLLEIMMKNLDPLNENLLMGKILEFDELTIPKLINILKDNTNDFLVERCIKFIYNSKFNQSDKVLDALPSIKVAHNLSMACLLLGLRGNKEVIKSLWDCYHFLKEEYPSKSYNQGPLLALSEIKNKYLNE